MLASYNCKEQDAVGDGRLRPQCRHFLSVIAFYRNWCRCMYLVFRSFLKQDALKANGVWLLKNTFKKIAEVCCSLVILLNVSVHMHSLLYSSLYICYFCSLNCRTASTTVNLTAVNLLIVVSDILCVMLVILYWSMEVHDYLHVNCKFYV